MGVQRHVGIVLSVRTPCPQVGALSDGTSLDAVYGCCESGPLIHLLFHFEQGAGDKCQSFGHYSLLVPASTPSKRTLMLFERVP